MNYLIILGITYTIWLVVVTVLFIFNKSQTKKLYKILEKSGISWTRVISNWGGSCVVRETLNTKEEIELLHKKLDLLYRELGYTYIDERTCKAYLIETEKEEKKEEI